MKIAIGSDIHVEFGSWPKLPDNDTDLLILAGDTGTLKQELRWIEEVQKHRPDMGIFCIPGNHTGYDGTPLSRHWSMRQTKVHDIHVVGATLWTDFNLYGDPIRDANIARFGMNDYRHCWFDNEVRLTPEHTISLHNTHIEFLQLYGKGADIVVTHHAPSIKSVHGKYFADKYNPAYASHLDWLVEELHPKYWIHGHMHDACEYKIGETTVICNPRGYPGENRGWDWRYLEL